MCFRRSRYWEEGSAETSERSLWDLFARDTEQTEPPLPVAEHEEPEAGPERERDDVPVG